MAAGDGLRVGPGLSVFFFHPRRSVAVLKGESHKIRIYSTVEIGCVQEIRFKNKI